MLKVPEVGAVYPSAGPLRLCFRPARPELPQEQQSHGGGSGGSKTEGLSGLRETLAFFGVGARQWGEAWQEDHRVPLDQNVKASSWEGAGLGIHLKFQSKKAMVRGMSPTPFGSKSVYYTESSLSHSYGALQFDFRLFTLILLCG